jgi:hypothetical protein
MGFLGELVSVIRVLHRSLRMKTLLRLIPFFVMLGSSSMRLCGELVLLGGFPVGLCRKLVPLSGFPMFLVHAVFSCGSVVHSPSHVHEADHSLPESQISASSPNAVAAWRQSTRSTGLFASGRLFRAAGS